jgi:ferredoxin-NADP reductase
MIINKIDGEIMEGYIVRILDIQEVTHNVRRYRVEKPDGYTFLPGQATEVSINLPGWKEEKRPFTFTCLRSESFLEFTIKSYPERNGVTAQLGRLQVGDELIIRDVWGAISYKGKGVFIAGGAGITPFISIFRDLVSKNELSGNMLIFANKTKSDIILESELSEILGEDFVNILSDEEVEGYHFGFITESFLKSVIDNYQQNFYVCGPPPMMDVVLGLLTKLGVSNNAITVEL